jgi:hypothetical protein
MVLAPHPGLLLYISKQAFILGTFPDVKDQECLQVDHSAAAGSEGAFVHVGKESIHSSSRWLARSNQSVSRGYKIGSTRLGNTENAKSEAPGWSPRRVTEVQFLSQDLETGVLVGFTRSGVREEKIYYQAEIGFDAHFRPIYILHTWPFKLICGRQRRAPSFLLSSQLRS